MSEMNFRERAQSAPTKPAEFNLKNAGKYQPVQKKDSGPVQEPIENRYRPRSQTVPLAPQELTNAAPAQTHARAQVEPPMLAETPAMAQGRDRTSVVLDVPGLLASGATTTLAIDAQKRQICETFNRKPKDGITALKGLCGGLDEAQTQQQIASFLLKNRENLDLAEVGDYLSGPEAENAAVLKKFTAEFAPNMADQDFNDAMRSFLKTMKLPGEAQKIDRMVEAFGNSYAQQNPTNFADGDAAYTLAFSTIMLNTDLHNPSIKNHMTFEQFVRNNRGMNKGQDFDQAILKKIYDDIKSKPIELNFAKTPPSYELNPNKLGKDKMLGKVTDQLGNNQVTALGIEGAAATVTMKKPWYGGLIGYKSTIEVTKDGNKVTMEISKPGFFSRGKPSVVIKPTAGDDSMNLAAQVAARFDADTIPKANFAYEREDMNSAVQQHRLASPMKVMTKDEALREEILDLDKSIDSTQPAYTPSLSREQVKSLVDRPPASEPTVEKIIENIKAAKGIEEEEKEEMIAELLSSQKVSEFIAKGGGAKLRSEGVHSVEQLQDAGLVTSFRGSEKGEQLSEHVGKAKLTGNMRDAIKLADRLATRSEAEDRAAFEDRLKNLGFDPKTYDNAYDRIAEYVRTAPVTINFVTSMLDKLLHAGTYQNMWERSVSYADEDYAKTRNETEKALHNLPEMHPDMGTPAVETLKTGAAEGGIGPVATGKFGAQEKRSLVIDRPHSAGVNAPRHRAGAAPGSSYGTSHIVLREAVKERSTITGGDSLEQIYKKELGEEAVGTFNHVGPALRRMNDQTLKYIARQVLTPNEPRALERGMDKTTPAYLEAQVFGEISLIRDVAKLVIDEDDLEAWAAGDFRNPYTGDKLPNRAKSEVKDMIQEYCDKNDIAVEYIRTGETQFKEFAPGAARNPGSDLAALKQSWELQIEATLEALAQQKWTTALDLARTLPAAPAAPIFESSHKEMGLTELETIKTAAKTIYEQRAKIARSESQDDIKMQLAELAKQIHKGYLMTAPKKEFTDAYQRIATKAVSYLVDTVNKVVKDKTDAPSSDAPSSGVVASSELSVKPVLEKLTKTLQLYDIEDRPTITLKVGDDIVRTGYQLDGHLEILYEGETHWCLATELNAAAGLGDL
jgi:guanine nucleotide exchange protein RalF